MKRFTILVGLLLLLLGNEAFAFQLPEIKDVEIKAGTGLNFSNGKLHDLFYVDLAKRGSLTLSLGAVEGTNKNSYKAAGIFSADLRGLIERAGGEFLFTDRSTIGIFYGKRPGDHVFGLFYSFY